MIFEYVPQVIGLLALCIYSVGIYKEGYDAKKFFNIAVVWSVIALLTFSFSIMMFVVMSIYLGTVYGFVFVVSTIVAMKFRNASKAT